MSTSDQQSSRPGSYGRSRHREASHAVAHAEHTPSSDPPAHPLIPRGPVPLIENNADLAVLIDHLRESGQFAYDSEFIGELSYVPKLCLLQVATRTQVALIDPLAPGLDLHPFWHLLADPSVEKIVHAGQQDIEPVVRSIGRAPANLFDTQIAAGFAGVPYPIALAKLVLDRIGARLGKGLTFTHWDQRPLSPAQLRYAADDVRYLPALRAEIGERLEQLGHLKWALDESCAMCDPALYGFDAETAFLRVRGSGSLTGRHLAALKELTVWRNDAARIADSPPRAYLRDEIMVELARTAPKTTDKLDRIRGLPRPVEQEQSANIIAAIERGLATPSEKLPVERDSEPSPAERFRCDSLWSLVQCLAASRSIDPNLLTSRQEINDVCKFLSSSDDEPPRVLTGWRREAVGEELLAILRGEKQLNLNWDGSGLARVKE